MALGIKVPEYEVDKKFWPDGHFEGSSLFEDELVDEVAHAAITTRRPGHGRRCETRL